VAGRASVFIFPDLDTGNTTYKAVQRSAQVVSIGPMLQGLAKPVNDLSRGALVEDVIYTIALTGGIGAQRIGRAKHQAAVLGIGASCLGNDARRGEQRTYCTGSHDRLQALDSEPAQARQLGGATVTSSATLQPPG
jgi:phosphate acetyl/butyryl transferase